MMRMRNMNTTAPPPPSTNATGEKEWEMRPGGMLVQKRTDSDQNHAAPPTIRVRVKYGSVYHEMNISSQATFGELKKMLTGATGLHHEDQKLFFKDKERDSKAFLDTVGVKDKSKLVLQEDPISQEKRYLEMRKNAKMEKAAKSISEISLEVDRIAGQVSAMETVISKGGKVAEKDVVNLIELLMNQLLKLDGIMADGDVKLQRKMQVRRVQKYVEALDILKVKNTMPATPSAPSVHHHSRKLSNGHVSSPLQPHRHSNGNVSSPQSRRSYGHTSLIDSPKQQPQPSRHSASGTTAPFIITTQWETFDTAPPPVALKNNAPISTWDLL